MIVQGLALTELLSVRARLCIMKKYALFAVKQCKRNVKHYLLMINDCKLAVCGKEY
jgi:hypothetical protein